MPRDDDKVMTIRLPHELWRKLKLLQIDGKIKSINDAAIRGLWQIVKEKEG